MIFIIAEDLVVAASADLAAALVSAPDEADLAAGPADLVAGPADLVAAPADLPADPAVLDRWPKVVAAPTMKE
jgi:hypothetical protein